MDLLNKYGIITKPFSLVYPPNKNGCNNVLLINNTVPDSELFMNSANDSTFPIIYSIASTKIELLELLKTTFTTIDRIGFVFASNLVTIHFFLDYKPFFDKNAPKLSENVQFIISIIKEFTVKNIDYLACNTLNYPNWYNYYSYLTQETGVIVGASNDKTGNIKYGGDWILESTSQDIETIYFSQSIKYYNYVLDVIGWANTGIAPTFLTVDDDYLYVSNVANGSNSTIGRISLTDPNNNNQSFITTVNYSQGLIVYNGYLYVANSGYNTIGKYSLPDPAIDSNDSWANTAFSPTGIAIDNGYLYVSCFDDRNPNNIINNISKINLADPINDNNPNWVVPTTVHNTNEYIYSIEIYNGYLYVLYWNDTHFTIMKISLSDPVNDINQTWVDLYQPNIFPRGITAYDGYLYVTNLFFNNGDTEYSIVRIRISDPTDINMNWKTILDFAWGCCNDGQYLYLSTITYDRIDIIDLPQSPPILSNICFPEGTPIQTDQGNIAIEKIKPGIHTIKQKRIVDITRTITPDTFLVGFGKDALKFNCPSQNTLMTKEHKIFYGGEMCAAKTFLGKFKKVSKVKYNGDILYNVLMEEYSEMTVNNLICETLHPDNIIAKLYTKQCKYSHDKRVRILFLLHKCIENKDYELFNKIVNSC